MYCNQTLVLSTTSSDSKVACLHFRKTLEKNAKLSLAESGSQMVLDLAPCSYPVTELQDIEVRLKTFPLSPQHVLMSSDDVGITSMISFLRHF